MPSCEFSSNLLKSPFRKKSMEYEEVPSVNWSQLPSTALELIYSFLGRKDQSSMSQVCKNWSEEYGSPSLWRTITFDLPEPALTTDIHPAVRSAQSYGQFFHHVRIVRRIGRCRMSEDIHRQLKIFLQSLAHQSQLLSISFRNFRFVLDPAQELGIEGEMLIDIHQSIIDLLSTQKKLQSVNFEDSRLDKPTALQILDTIFSVNSRTLKNLELKGFIDIDSDEDWGRTFSDLASTLETLMNLENLTIDYSFYFEQIITLIYQHGSELQLKGKGKLQKLRLYCSEAGEVIVVYDGIEPEAWKYFKKVFPALLLDAYIEIHKLEEIHVFIVHHMPISFLVLNWPRSDDSELGIILRHLRGCEINRNLEFLIIRVGKANNLTRDLLTFSDACPLLQMLELHFWSPVNGLDAVFEHWLENSPMMLVTVHIVIETGGDKVQISAIKNLADTYVPLLRDMGISLSISPSESIWE